MCYYLCSCKCVHVLVECCIGFVVCMYVCWLQCGRTALPSTGVKINQSINQSGLFRQLPIRMYTCSNLKAGLALVVYLNNQQVVASLTALSFREIVTCIMSSTPTADPPVNTEDNSTTSDQPVAQLPAGLSAEDAFSELPLPWLLW